MQAIEKSQISKIVEKELKILKGNLETIFQSRKNRSKFLRETVTLLIEQLVEFYEKILLLSPVYKRGVLPETDLLKRSIILMFVHLKNLNDTKPFFDLLEWVSTMVVFYIHTVEELDNVKKNHNIVLAVTEQLGNTLEDIINNYWKELSSDVDDPLDLCGDEKGDEKNDEMIKMLQCEIDLKKGKLEVLERENIELRENFIKVNYEGQDASKILKDLYIQAKLARNMQLADKLESILDCSDRVVIT
jgi:hypothetical protein